MVRPSEEIYYREIPSLIQKLINFLGAAEVRRCLQRYEASLQSAGPFFREYYLQFRHPWWAAFTQYFNLEKKGLSVRKHLTDELKRLGGDAKKVTALQKQMPETVRKKYKKDLMDDDAASAYLFELNIAWHFVLSNYDVQWHEDNTGRHSEFIVKAPDLEFEVECKRIKADTSRKIRKRDFYRFAEKLIQKVYSRGYAGTIDIVLNDRLHSDEQSIIKLANEIVTVLNAGEAKGDFQTALGALTLDLRSIDGIAVDLQKLYKNLWERKSPHALGAIFARSKNGAPVDPIELTLSSLKSDDYIKGIRNKISDAAKSQLSRSMPGFIVCFLEGIDDLRGLEKDSALQEMCHYLFLKEDLSHVAAIGYSSETIIHRMTGDERHFNQGLIFRNPNCRYDAAKAFPFFSKEDLGWISNVGK